MAPDANAVGACCCESCTTEACEHDCSCEVACNCTSCECDDT